MPSDYERSVFLPDAHFPYVDKPAFATALAFVKHFKPDVVWILGDWADFYQLSRFDKNPDRRFQLQSELDEIQVALAQVRDAAGPDASIKFTGGNHEFRLRKYLWTQAPELASLRSMDLGELLAFKSAGIEWGGFGPTAFHGYTIKHGNVARKWAGYSARAEFESTGQSGLSGHTHRLGHFYRTDATGMYSWMECGCLCDLQPEYAEGRVMDWQHGVAYGYFEKTAHRRAAWRFETHLLPIISGKIVWDGVEIVG